MSSNPIPRRNSKRFNLTVSFIAAVLIAGLLVFAKPYYDKYRAKKVEAVAETPQASTETNWKTPSKEVQAKASLSEKEESKLAPDPIVTAPLTNQTRAVKPDDVRGQPPTQGSPDPWANLKIDKKGQ